MSVLARWIDGTASAYRAFGGARATGGGGGIACAEFERKRRRNADPALFCGAHLPTRSEQIATAKFPFMFTTAASGSRGAVSGGDEPRGGPERHPDGLRVSVDGRVQLVERLGAIE